MLFKHTKKTFLTKLKQKKCQKRSIKAVFTHCGKYCGVQTLSVDVDVWVRSAQHPFQNSKNIKMGGNKLFIDEIYGMQMHLFVNVICK